MLDLRISRSLSLVALLLLTSVLGMIQIPNASAVTTSGEITTSETWTGTVNLNGNLTVAEGAKLIINAGTTVNIPAGDRIIVEGSICAGDSSCGASPASTGNPIRLRWATGPDEGTGNCYVNPINNPDPSCGSGVYLDYTVDQALTKLNYVFFEKAYGIPVQVSQGTYLYAALVFNDASIDARGLSFEDINTTNVLVLNSAAPTISDSTFTLGVDGQQRHGSAIQAIGAGKGILGSLTIRNSAFSAPAGSPNADADCQNGLSAIFIENSDIEIDTITVSDNSHGVFFKASSGQLINSNFDVTCTAIDTNSYKTTTDASFVMSLNNNSITTEEGAGITAYDGAIIVANDNTISGASESSGFGIRDSFVTINRNEIGPIGGWNGLWIYGESDVIAQNNTFTDIAKEAVLIGEYHYKDGGPGYNQEPTKSRIHFADNDVSGINGTCTSSGMYGGDFQCPALHVFMASASIINNNITSNSGDGIRVLGGIVNVQDNYIEAGEFAARISQFDDKYGSKYGSIGFFSGNDWSSNVEQIYNVTESKVVVQSETFDTLDSNPEHTVWLKWASQTCEENVNACLKVPPSKEWPPRDMPIAMAMKDNATTFTFADLNNFEIGDVYMRNQGSEWGVQIEEGELVRYQVKAKNSQVAGATVRIMDSFGKELYDLKTDQFGFTQWVTLASNFHIDHNWNRVWNEPDLAANWIAEDSCTDAIDNDGDGVSDELDPDCAEGSGTRELSVYRVDVDKFDKGRSSQIFTLSGSIDQVINLENMAPSVRVDQLEDKSFARIISLTGSAWDGLQFNTDGTYFNDANATEAMFGTINRVEIQPHGSTTWYLAKDESGANGQVNKSNYPFKQWSYERDMSDHFEEDVTFRIKSYDGLDESQITTRVYRLNINPPTTIVDSPQNGTTHSDGEVRFSGTSSDAYRGGIDLEKVYFKIEGPNEYSTLTSIEASTSWAYDWSYGGTNLYSGEYTFTIWTSDSSYCRGEIGECDAQVVKVFVDNNNRLPIVQVDSPKPLQIIHNSETISISGVARDNDGTVSRVEFEMTDITTGLAINNGPDPVTSFLPNGYWETSWNTSQSSELTHNQYYDLKVKSYDTIDYSVTETVRLHYIRVGNTANLDPLFNSEGWSNTKTIFCDENSKSPDKCGGGASINLLDFFTDPDGIGVNESHFITYEVYDDPSSSDDDTYNDFITINKDGVATYDPMDYMHETTSFMSEWSILNVIFEVRDLDDVPAYSFTVNFIIKPIEFTSVRQDEGQIITGNNAVYTGSGLPNSKVVARLLSDGSDEGDFVNETIVGPDGNWRMEISYAQIGTDGDVRLVFTQDGQTAVGTYGVSAGIAEPEGLATWMWVVMTLVALVLLIGAGAFFFVEFDDEFVTDEDGVESEKEHDPYAWAKTDSSEPQQAVVAPAQQQAVAQQAVAPQPVQQSQHPGWIWDAAANQWVPDPNYQP